MAEKAMHILGLVVGLTCLVAPVTQAEENLSKYVSGSVKSGYFYSAPETRAMQDDDFANPGYILVDHGLKVWDQKDGKEGKSCASCHTDLSKDMGDVGAVYPKYNERLKKVLSVEGQINVCRVERMGASALKLDSDDLLGLTILVKNQAKGKPIKVDISRPEVKKMYEDGKDYYLTRKGQLDLSCASCHEQNAGNYIRTELLSMGLPTGFPVYRLKWENNGTFIRRAYGCIEDNRADPPPKDDPIYVALELYLMHKANGLPVETPGVRK